MWFQFFQYRMYMQKIEDKYRNSYFGNPQNVNVQAFLIN